MENAGVKKPLKMALKKQVFIRDATPLLWRWADNGQVLALVGLRLFEPEPENCQPGKDCREEFNVATQG